MRVNANAVLRSWTLLAAFGGSCPPGLVYSRLRCLAPNKINSIIGASVSEPHLGSSTRPLSVSLSVCLSVCLSIYIYIYIYIYI